MKCLLCVETAVFDEPGLCKKHFNIFVEKKVAHTIKTYGLLKKTDNVCVAVSGGKDSLTVLHILKKLGYAVEGLAIDEGIKEYREKTLADLKKYCNENDVKYKVVSFEKDIGKPLDAMVEGRIPCGPCGTFRRYLLNKHAKGYDKIATGHNLDDESQSVLMNLTKANTTLFTRQGPVASDTPGFTKRIKPLYFLTEKMIRAYTLLNQLKVSFGECPYARQSYRASIRDTLNEYEATTPGTKVALATLGASMHEEPKQAPLTCASCGQPSSNQNCQACVLKEVLV